MMKQITKKRRQTKKQDQKQTARKTRAPVQQVQQQVRVTVSRPREQPQQVQRPPFPYPMYAPTPYPQQYPQTQRIDMTPYVDLQKQFIQELERQREDNRRSIESFRGGPRAEIQHPRSGFEAGNLPDAPPEEEAPTIPLVPAHHIQQIREDIQPMREQIGLLTEVLQENESKLSQYTDYMTTEVNSLRDRISKESSLLDAESRRRAEEIEKRLEDETNKTARQFDSLEEKLIEFKHRLSMAQSQKEIDSIQQRIDAVEGKIQTLHDRMNVEHQKVKSGMDALEKKGFAMLPSRKEEPEEATTTTTTTQPHPRSGFEAGNLPDAPPEEAKSVLKELEPTTETPAAKKTPKGSIRLNKTPEYLTLEGIDKNPGEAFEKMKELIDKVVAYENKTLPMGTTQADLEEAFDIFEKNKAFIRKQIGITKNKMEAYIPAVEKRIEQHKGKK